MKREKYYLGLDIGTGSVGYAVARVDYSLCKFHGEPMWGTTLFEAANQCADRRSFRTARRRLDRRQQRVHLLQDIFAHEIDKIDPNFFIRIKESALYTEDRTNIQDRNSIFNDPGYQDKHYHAEYPTIHHLIYDLMQSDKPHDVRLVYIACAWLVAHRGHFLSDISMENISTLLSFDEIYDELARYFAEHEYPVPWVCDTNEFSNILKTQVGITAKTNLFKKLLNNGKSFKDPLAEHPCDRDSLVKLLSGGTAAPKTVFLKDQYAELESITLGKDEEKLESILALLDEEDTELIRILQKIVDWAALVDILKDNTSISQAKVHVYDQHKNDLKQLKTFIKKYCPEKYKEIFNSTKSDLKNYAAYSYHYNTIKSDPPKRKATKEEFSKYLLQIVKKILPKEKDKKFYDDMIERLELCTFLPKQVNSDNRVIPYQLYLYELQALLERVSVYLPWLTQKDADNLSPLDKIISVFSFRVPYYVGPLRNDENNKNAWLKRLADKSEKIYPWNFNEIVDTDACEQEFIDRMTNSCTYLPDETVLPKNSLLYCRFAVLNEINNIKINGIPITVDQKQLIFEECVKKHQRVSKKRLEDFCKSNGIMGKGDILEGIDIQLTATLKPYLDFMSLMQGGILAEEQIEEIITRSAYMEDTVRFSAWIRKKYPHIQENDVRYIVRKRYKDFGRLSAAFLNELEGSVKDTGETGTIMYFLWNTNYNLMQLLSEKFTFSEQIKQIRSNYYCEHPMSVQERLEDMYVPNAVKRPIIRTLDIVKEVVHAQGHAPEKIFVEMARGTEEKKRTKSRKDQLLELYKSAKEDTKELEKQLADMGDMAENNLQSEALYLYYLQLGRCMYTNTPLDLSKLKSDLYNIDHIYPQHYVKDDSIHNNKVLVLSTANADKGDIYPIAPDVQGKMLQFWKKLHENGLIGDEKFKRLTRKVGFTDDEKLGFINRQLVETRQSTKAVATLLKELYPETDIVYVKAGLVADFRHEFGLVKCRSVNDLHHAKDAYLNIVAGNVYHCRFTKNFWIDQKYSLKTREIFTHDVVVNGDMIWTAGKSLELVKRMYAKNSVHLTRYAICKKSGQSGGLFNQNPEKASCKLVPRKKGLDPIKYGGYNNKTISAFVLVKHRKGNSKSELEIIPIDLMAMDKLVNNENSIIEYASHYLNKPVSELSLPLGLRILKINTVFSIDGLRVCLASKHDSTRIALSPMFPVILNEDQVAYIKVLESFKEKIKKNPNIKLSNMYDKISKEKNCEIYDILCHKTNETILKKLPGSQSVKMSDERTQFSNSTIEEQINSILQILTLYRIGLNGSSREFRLSTKLSGWKYQDIRIIDQSAAGLYESRFCNLLELL